VHAVGSSREILHILLSKAGLGQVAQFARHGA
jgi:hypothetical protein